ncbi:hypothetical protein CBS101457_005071 [Exobasidium rhododendri]|nr:hypothetical protein CBS101457_005071 [Exobasidium rhododendri]
MISTTKPVLLATLSFFALLAQASAAPSPSHQSKKCVQVAEKTAFDVRLQKGFKKVESLSTVTVTKPQTGNFRLYITKDDYYGTIGSSNSGGITLKSATLKALATAPGKANVVEFVYNEGIVKGEPVSTQVYYWLDRADACTVAAEDLQSSHVFPWIGANFYERLD